MDRPIASVHMDIAEFVTEVGEIRGDAELGRWTRKLAKCLGRRDQSLHEFGARLLSDAIRFQAEASEKKRQAAYARWGNPEKKSDKSDAAHSSALQRTASHGSADANDATEQTEQTEQSRADRENPPLAPQGGEPPKICTEFEAARKAFPGPRRGYEVEYTNFLRQAKKAGLKPSEVLPLLLPAVQRYKAVTEKKSRQESRPPFWQHFKTWINNQGWTTEYPGEKSPTDDGAARALEHYREKGFWPSGTPSAWMVVP
jgi:hypothetical protein